MEVMVFLIPYNYYVTLSYMNKVSDKICWMHWCWGFAVLEYLGGFWNFGK